jgi:hypothetical protein
MDGANAPVDEEVLRSMATTFRTDDRVASVRFIGADADEHKHLAVELDEARYPERIRKARLETQWYRNDGFNAHYVEAHADGEVWQCRWDRHANDHSAPGQFHPPPDAGEPTDVDFPEDYRDVTSVVLGAIQGRIDAVWE